MTPADVDAIVAAAWDAGAWTLDDFTRATGFEARTVEFSVARLYLISRIHFDPTPGQKAGSSPKTKGKNNGTSE